MMRVARPTTVSNRTLNRLILICGLALVVGLPAMVLVYWNDRHVDPGASFADREVTAAEAAVQANPNDIAARDHLAAAYVTAKRFDDGIAQFTEALNIDAADRAALLGRGIAYVQSGQADLAVPDLRKFIDAASKGEFANTDPQLEQAYYWLGTVLLERDKAADAVTSLEKALAIDAGDADALYSLGGAQIRVGDPTKAVAALRLAIAYVPTGWPDPYRRLAEAYTALHEADGAAWAAGMAAFCEGRLDDAAAALRPLTAGVMKADALLGLGFIAAQQGENTAAASYFRQVLAIDPANTSAQIGLSAIDAAASSVPSVVPSPSAEGSN